MAVYHPDGPLILRLRAGDVDALGELYKRYKTSIYRTALAITRDQGAAEDILQESFLRLFTHAHRIRPDVPLHPWLYRVAVNLSYKWLRKQQKQQKATSDGVLEGLAASFHFLPEQWIERREAQEAIREAITQLPLGHRVVVVLFYLEELSLKEIAEILRIPEGTVKSRLHYARRFLRDTLEGRVPVGEIVYEFT
ncbi:MAG TPA: sigma-70 family RNA polymerase sigma factor [Chloroflexi bacterium]|nr:sigma-70 family RNA polymerase sigma factor [Chloroflexota bacterium]